MRQFLIFLFVMSASGIMSLAATQGSGKGVIILFILSQILFYGWCFYFVRRLIKRSNRRKHEKEYERRKFELLARQEQLIEQKFEMQQIFREHLTEQQRRNEKPG